MGNSIYLSGHLQSLKPKVSNKFQFFYTRITASPLLAIIINKKSDDFRGSMKLDSTRPEFNLNKQYISLGHIHVVMDAT